MRLQVECSIVSFVVRRFGAWLLYLARILGLRFCIYMDRCLISFFLHCLFSLDFTDRLDIFRLTASISSIL